MILPSLPARAPCLAPTDPRRPSPASSTHRFNFQPKCLLPVFVQTLIVAPTHPVASFCANFDCFHPPRPTWLSPPSTCTTWTTGRRRGQVLVNFLLITFRWAQSLHTISGKEIFSSIHPPYLQCLLQTGGTNDGRQWKCTFATCWLLAHGRFCKDRIQNWFHRCFSYIYRSFSWDHNITCVS